MKERSRLKKAAFAVILLLLGQPALAGSDGGTCDGFAPAVQAASELRELEPLRPIPCRSLSAREFMAARQGPARRQGPAERAEELLYRALRLIPPDYRYSECFAKSAGRDLLAFFEPGRRVIFVRENRPPAADVLVHEIVHALQTQHFDVNALQQGWSRTTDSALAGAALSEGDALEVQRVYCERPGCDQDSDGEELLMQRDECTLPEAIQRQLDFPYQQGPVFVKRLRAEGGWRKVNDSYGRRLSSRDILWADRKAAPPQLSNPALPGLITNGSPRMLFADSLGEYMIRLFFLRLSPRQAVLAAKGWAADRVAVYGDARSSSVVWRSIWETAEEAQEFRRAAVVVFSRVHGMRLDAEASSLWATTAHGERLVIRASDKEVLLVIAGLPPVM